MTTTQSTLLFLHLPKTAGTTLCAIAARNYAPQNTLDICDTPSDFCQLQALDSKRLQNLTFIYGHFSFGIHRLLLQKFLYVTILREPKARTISHYLHVKYDPTHWFHEECIRKKYSLVELLECGHLLNLDNLMTRLISGVGNVAYGSCTKEMLQLADFNLANHFDLVGLDHLFDEFLIELSLALGWTKPLYYSRKLIAKAPAEAEALLKDQTTVQAILTHNQFDNELFRIWKPRIEERILQRGPEFCKSVSRFRRNNKLLTSGWRW
jgi:hypothetical protein